MAALCDYGPSLPQLRITPGVGVGGGGICCLSAHVPKSQGFVKRFQGFIQLFAGFYILLKIWGANLHLVSTDDIYIVNSFFFFLSFWCPSAPKKQKQNKKYLNN